MKLLFPIIGFLLFSLFVPVFAQEENEILWEKDVLTWDDFQGMVNQLPEGYEEGEFDGFTLTNQYLQIQWEISNESPCWYQFTLIKSWPVFVKDGSWVNEKIKDDLELLKHEQTHFDMAEIHARQFNEKVHEELMEKEFECPITYESLEEEIDEITDSAVLEIFDQITILQKKMSIDYDNETNHGLNEEAQLKWNQKISCLLENTSNKNECNDSSKITTEKIPAWIKNNAGWWADGSIDDDSFVQGIQYLIKEGIIKVPITEQEDGTQNNKIPDWIKNNAGWWAEGSIDDNSFVQGIQYLIKEGIIQI